VEINRRIVDGVAILDLSGRVTLGEHCELINETVGQLLDEGDRSFVLNLSGVSYVDSAGLGEIVHAHSVVVRRGGTFNLEGTSERLQSLFGVTRLFRLFESDHPYDFPGPFGRHPPARWKTVAGAMGVTFLVTAMLIMGRCGA
jgi:anti-sigma B factor antagonist